MTGGSTDGRHPALYTLREDGPAATAAAAEADDAMRYYTVPNDGSEL